MRRRAAASPGGGQRGSRLRQRSDRGAGCPGRSRRRRRATDRADDRPSDCRGSPVATSRRSRSRSRTASGRCRSVPCFTTSGPMGPTRASSRRRSPPPASRSPRSRRPVSRAITSGSRPRRTSRQRAHRESRGPVPRVRDRAAHGHGLAPSLARRPRDPRPLAHRPVVLLLRRACALRRHRRATTGVADGESRVHAGGRPNPSDGLIGLQYWFFYPYNYYPVVTRSSLMEAPVAATSRTSTCTRETGSM